MKSALITEIIRFFIPIIECVLVCFLSFQLRKQKRINKELREEVTKQKHNCAVLVRHMEEIARTDGDEKKTALKIEEVKNDEEIAEIVNAILALNNSRVSNASGK